MFVNEPEMVPKTSKMAPSMLYRIIFGSSPKLIYLFRGSIGRVPKRTKSFYLEPLLLSVCMVIPYVKNKRENVLEQLL